MILVVDDDQRVLDEAQIHFKKLGHDIAVAKDGKVALEIFLQGRIRLVIVDALLPKLSGQDLIKEIFATRKGSQAICLLLSGIYKQPAVQAEMQKKSGAHGFITKPLTLNMCQAITTEYAARLISNTSEPQLSAGGGGATGTATLPTAISVDTEPMSEAKLNAYLLKGHLAEAPVFKVLWLMHRFKLSGVLTFSNGSEKMSIHYTAGSITHIEGLAHTLLFGQILVAQGYIKEAELDGVISTLGTEQRLGNTLVDKALISPHVIDEILYFQQFERLGIMCDWNIERFEYSPSQVKQGLEYKFSLFDLFYEMAFSRISYDMLVKWYQTKLKPVEFYWVRDPTVLQQWKPDAKIQAVLKPMEGLRQPVEQWIRSHKGKEELALRVLYFLSVLDALRFVEKGREAKTVASIQAMYQEYLSMDFFERLGVTKWTTPEEVKTRFRALSKDFHPDMRPPDESTPIKQAYGKIFELLNEAHDALKDRDNIERYRKHGRLITDEDLGMADDSFKKGQREFARKNYGAAKQYFERSYQLDPENGLYLANLAWAQLYLINKAIPGYEKAMEQILADIQKSKEMSPDSIVPLMVLGNFYKVTNQLDKAARAFEDAQNLDPDNKDAQRELRLMVMRESKTEKDNKKIFGIKLR